MGFYGNIKNTSQIQFQFDRIFESRTDMDSAATKGTDKIFNGRFVLVKYDPDGSYFIGNTLLGFLNPDNNKIYLDKAFTLPLIYITFTHVDDPTEANWNSYYYFDGKFYLKLPDKEHYQANNMNYYTRNADDTNILDGQYVGLNTLVRLRDLTTGVQTETYYKCSGGTPGQPADWTVVLPNADFSKYIINFNKDRVTYGKAFDPRGYDATVWEKIYSEGIGRFILIARLNGGLFPDLELYPDPPSELPSSPYIDTLSTEALYRIHVPSMFGFQIKTINKEENPTALSDQKALINQVVYNEDRNEYISTPIETDVAIYFNKDGSNKIYRNIDTTTVNKILIEPTGESGKIYYDNAGNEITKDLLELTVHIPAIGNMIADGYDLIYGVNEKNNSIRTTDINWYSGDSSESLKKDGNTLLGGKTYDLNTLAGSLNVIHDIIGQIVVPLETWPSQDMINTLSQRYLYTYNNEYYRLGYIYKTTPVTDYIYTQQTNVTQEEFKTNKYFYKVGNSYYWAKEYNPSYATNNYYCRNVNSVRYVPITLTSFLPGQYYLKEGENYFCDNAQYPTYLERTYFEVAANLVDPPFTGQYRNNGRFYTLEEGNYIPSKTSSPENIIYYEITQRNTYSNYRFFHPNTYYYEKDGQFLLAAEYDSSLEPYYCLTFEDTPQYGYNQYGQVIQYYRVAHIEENVIFTKWPEGVAENQLFTLVNGEYISYQNIKNLPTLQNQDPYTIPRTYYTLNITSHNPGTLYLPGIYYTKDDSNNYIKSYGDWIEDESYYLIQHTTQVEHPFYMPNIYYYQPEPNSYLPSSSDQMDNEEQYYEKSAVYVQSDELKQCPYGYEWKDNVAYIPPSITLFTAEKKLGLINISNFGENTNSLYGLLLQLNKLYAPGEDISRDIDTLRGAYNVLQDILYQIKTLKPGNLLIVNDFGQIESISLANLKSLLNNI